MRGLFIVRRRSIVLGLLIAFLLISSFRYQVAVPGRAISFPRDHFSHPGFKTEWWYYTGHLETVEGDSFGYQMTFFRFGLRDRQGGEKGSPPLFTDLYMAHFALSDKKRKKFFFRDRANRGYGGRAGALANRYLVWNEDWKVEARGEGHVIDVKDQDRGLRLRLTPLKPPALHGQKGLSRKGKGKGRASYYYSLTRLKTEGILELQGRQERVHGVSWMDHEFGSDQLGQGQVGWDWFGIQLENGTEIMLYLIRREDGSPDPHSSGTLVYRNGTTLHLTLDRFQVKVLEMWKSPKSGGKYPMRWKIAIPAEEVELEVIPFFPNQELDTRKSTRVTYWEGSVHVRGVYRKKPIQGLGYVEMTGYVGRLKI
ncbi:MAG: lipocalin-like domain-containing protein [Candidatus Binatia bacterium]